MNAASTLHVQAMRNAVAEHGFVVIPDVLAHTEVDALQQATAQVATHPTAALTGKGIYALRNLLDVSPEVRALSQTISIRNLVEPILGRSCFPVRGILFDKIPNANWKVPFHQDVTIAVREKIEVEGFGSWSMKAGVLHTQPPAAVLEAMLSVRVHLDDCHEQNGALRVIPGSHRHGRIPESSIDSVRQECEERLCAVTAGGAMLMRPLLLHASSPARTPGHRRVIHIDFAARELPSGLHWL